MLAFPGEGGFAAPPRLGVGGQGRVERMPSHQLQGFAFIRSLDNLGMLNTKQHRPPTPPALLCHTNFVT